MICKTGGFVEQQNDEIRNFFARTLDSVCEKLALSLICSLSAVKFSNRVLRTHLTKRVLTLSATISGQEEALRLIRQE